MITLICDKCYRVYGCRPHYHPEGKFMVKLCSTCPVGGYCDYLDKTMFTLEKIPDTIEEGYCPSCLERGGGL